jgi:hypothetical protein
MKRGAYFLTIVGILVLFAGCKKQESDADGVRAGINQHLLSLKTINLGAMDMSVTNISVQGNEAQAQVEFKPKSGGAPGAAMQVSYSLQKQNGQWVVQNTQAAGGSMQHPGPGENPNANPGAPSTDSMPNFRDLVPGGSGAGGSPSTLPPGHPPMSAPANGHVQ